MAEIAVRVLAFGILRELLGAAELPVTVPEGSTVEEVVAVCRARAPESGVWDVMAVAVEQEYSRRDRRLAGGETVALLPPVSGGYS